MFNLSDGGHTASGVLRWLGVLVAIAAPLALNVSPAAAATDGVGFASARGTDPDAIFEHGLGDEDVVSASFSGISNCDETQPLRPFYVRWTDGTTSHLFKKNLSFTTVCRNFGVPDQNFAQETGSGTVDGSIPADFNLNSNDSPDEVFIEVEYSDLNGFLAFLTIQVAPPQPWSGSPGGVWLFGELPWPSG